MIQFTRSFLITIKTAIKQKFPDLDVLKIKATVILPDVFITSKNSPGCIHSILFKYGDHSQIKVEVCNPETDEVYDSFSCKISEYFKLDKKRSIFSQSYLSFENEVELMQTLGKMMDEGLVGDYTIVDYTTYWISVCSNFMCKDIVLANPNNLSEDQIEGF